MTELGGNSKEQLKSIIQRVENLDEQIKGLSDDKNDIFKEAKGNGFDVKALRTIVRMRKMDPEDRANQDAVLESYMLALGMI